MLSVEFKRKLFGGSDPAQFNPRFPADDGEPLDLTRVSDFPG